MTTTTDPEDDGLAELRALARRLFGGRDTAEEEPPPDPARSNVSPREGTNPPGGDPQDLRAFVARLFAPTD